jgi:hypothetical protein
VNKNLNITVLEEMPRSHGPKRRVLHNEKIYSLYSLRVFSRRISSQKDKVFKMCDMFAWGGKCTQNFSLKMQMEENTCKMADSIDLKQTECGQGEGLMVYMCNQLNNNLVSQKYSALWN